MSEGDWQGGLDTEMTKWHNADSVLCRIAYFILTKDYIMATPTYRITLTIDEINDLIFDICLLNTQGNGLQPNSKSALTKLQQTAFKDKIGAATPAYVQTGRNHPKAINIASLTEMDTNITKDKIVASSDYLGIERRNQGDNPATYTPEQKFDAECKAADYFVETGIKKDWHEFLSAIKQEAKPEEERRQAELNKNDGIDDTALFKML
jgi:hypothetical protein